MKIGVYDVINDPLPKLLLIKEISVKESDFKDEEKIVNIMNDHIKMDKLTSENVYVLGLTNSLYPKGIVHVSTGNCNHVEIDYRKMSIGLLLIGAEQFMCFHNHPGYSREITLGDRCVTNKYIEISELLEINFIKHIMITKDYYGECDEISSEEMIEEVKRNERKNRK